MTWIEIPHSRKLLISYAAGAILFYLFLRNTDWSSMRNGLRSVAWPLLLAAVMLRIAALVVSALRWHTLLLPARNVKRLSIVAAMMIGVTVTTTVSMEASEFIRPYILSKREHLDFTSTLSTVVVEWLLDLLAILALFLPALILVKTGNDSQIPFSQLNRAAIAVVLISTLGLVVLRALHRRSSVLVTYLERSHSGLPRTLARQVQHFSAGLNVLQQGPGLAAVSGYSLLLSFLTALSCWVALAAFGIVLPFVAAFILLGLISLGGMIPTPGAIGGFHAICQFGLVAFFGVESSHAILPVIGMHAVLYIPASIIGVFCMFFYMPKETQSAL